MSAFVVGVPVPEGLDPKVYRVRVVVDRIDGADLTTDDLARIEAVYPSKPAKRRAKPTSAAAPHKAKAAPKAKASRRAGRAA